MVQKAWDVCLNFGVCFIGSHCSTTHSEYPLSSLAFSWPSWYWPMFKSGAWWYGQRAEAKFLEHCSCPCTSQAASTAVFHVKWQRSRSPITLQWYESHIWSLFRDLFPLAIWNFLVTLINLFHIQLGKWINQNLKLFPFCLTKRMF